MGKKTVYFIHLFTYWFIWQVRRETLLPQPTSTTSATLKMLQFISPSLLTRCCCSFGRTFHHRRRNQGSQARTADFQHLSSEPNRQTNHTHTKKAHRSTTVSVVASRNVLTWQQIRPIPVERKLHAFDRRNWKSGKTVRREGKKDGVQSQPVSAWECTCRQSPSCQIDLAPSLIQRVINTSRDRHKAAETTVQDFRSLLYRSLRPGSMLGVSSWTATSCQTRAGSPQDDVFGGGRKLLISSLLELLYEQLYTG